MPSGDANLTLYRPPTTRQGLNRLSKKYSNHGDHEAQAGYYIICYSGVGDNAVSLLCGYDSPAKPVDEIIYSKVIQNQTVYRCVFFCFTHH